MTCGCTKNEKEEAKRLQGVRKLRQDEEIAWAPQRHMTKWPDCEEARKLEHGEWRLEPEGKRKCGKSLSCRMPWKAFPLTWMAKAVTSR